MKKTLCGVTGSKLTFIVCVMTMIVCGGLVGVSASDMISVEGVYPVTDVRWYRVDDERVVVYYTLEGTDSADISLSISLDDGASFRALTNEVSGDTGRDVSSGTMKRIELKLSVLEMSDHRTVRLRLVPAIATPLSDDTFSDGHLQELLVLPLLSPIEFDGVPNESAWQEIDPLPVVMQAPHYGEAPSERTEIMMGFDDTYLYVGARLYDKNPERIHATTMKRDDDDSSSDSFGVLLDTFNDNENAVLFVTTPKASRTDKAIYGDLLGGGSSAGGANTSWNTFWNVRTVITDEGWFAEMRIPLSSLRFQESDDGVIMGVSVFRWIARKYERIVYPAISQKWGSSSHLRPSLSNDARFQGLKSRRPLYITPYLLGGIGQEWKLDADGEKYERDDDPDNDAGLDIKYGISGNATLDVTVNTDFAQVEADDQQINLTRYSLFFPEKRMFFLERESTFDFSFYSRNRLFHSRRIGISGSGLVPLYGGARLYGRVGAWDLGILNMQTKETGGIQSENFGVVRVRRQLFNPYSFVGAMVTSRAKSGGAYNTAYGIDSTIRLFGDDILKLNWAQTFEDTLDNEPFTIDNAKIRVHWERYRHFGWGYGLNYSRAGKDYNPGLGYERWENLTNWIHFLRYGWSGSPESFLFKYEWYEDFWLHKRNEDGSVKSCLARSGWNITAKSGYTVSLSATYNYEDIRKPFSFSDDCIVPVDTYEFYGVTGRASTPGGRLFRVSTSFKGGEFYDGTYASVSVSPSQSISSHLEVGGTYQLNTIDFSDRNQSYDAHIGRLRALAMLSVKYSVSAFVQYNSAVDTIVSNVRFRYNPREGNDFYIVYDEAFNTDRERLHPILPQTKNRTVLVKYTYTFNI